MRLSTLPRIGIPSLAIAIFISVVPQHILLAEDLSVSVTIGGSKRLAACSERARVEGGRKVSLMRGPDRTSQRVIYLPSGTQLFVCERRGEWLGVVVAAVDPETCGVSVSIERREPYRGGCASGWVLQAEVVLSGEQKPGSASAR